MIKTMQRTIAGAGKQIRQAFLGLVARGSGKSLQLKGLDNEVLQDVEVIQHVGFSSWIPEGSKVVIIPLGGKTSRAVIAGSTSAPLMVEVSEGETCIYDQFGHELRLTETGIKTNCDMHVGGNLTADGDVSDSKSSMQEMRDIYNEHTNGNTPPPTQKM